MSDQTINLIIGGVIGVAGSFVSSVLLFLQSWLQRRSEDRKVRRELFYRYAHEDWREHLQILRQKGSGKILPFTAWIVAHEKLIRELDKEPTGDEAIALLKDNADWSEKLYRTLSADDKK